MIARLQGRVEAVDEEFIVLDVQGVGYEVFAPAATVETCTAGDEKVFWIYTHVREDALCLYGFETPAEKKLFLSLLKVNGVGPKMAMKILSGAAPLQVRDMIENGDVRGLSQLPKVGKKTAEQIVLTLKGKLEFADAPAQRAALAPRGAREEILSALVHLGFRAGDAEKVVMQMPVDVDVQEGIRKGLSQLAQI